MDVSDLRIMTNEADRNAADLVKLCAQKPVPPDVLFSGATRAALFALNQLQALGVRVFNRPNREDLMQALKLEGGVRVVVTCWGDENLQAQEVWTEDNNEHEQE